MALFPAIAARYGGSRVLGLLYAAPPVGTLVATMTSGSAGRIHRHGRAVVVAAATWGAAVVVFGLAGPLWLALAGLVVAGGADMVHGDLPNHPVEWTVPDSLHRGRLASIELVSYPRDRCWATQGRVAAAVVGSARRWCSVAACACAGDGGRRRALLPALRNYERRRLNVAERRAPRP